jgi:hypothetical protein
MMRIVTNAYKILVRKMKWKRPLGRPRCRGEDDGRIDLKIIQWEGVDWMYLAQDRPVVGLCEHSDEPWVP